MATVAIIGDVGGCLEQLAAAVDALDDPATVVVQVGDLVDRGPDSSGVLSYVGDRLAGGRWVQLVGNHDAQYVGKELQPFWPERLADGDAALLRGWWLRDRLRVAAAVRTSEGEELLVTHAGLSRRAWGELGDPVTAGTAAALLNTRPEPLLWADDGPLWTEAGTNLYPGWLEEVGPPMPFSQVHVHSSIVDWDRTVWRCREHLRDRSTVDWAARHTVTRAGGARFIAVDPRHGKRGAAAWSPLILRGATLLE
ncbi:metallophosphoesterase [Dactylosporangium sp. CS-047395]|uniref:metallophosphoesterase n=1 Tax=Dactylosporangium sp. CS-047395 TaxID=3239936 RepID=UPI003D8CA8AC